MSRRRATLVTLFGSSTSTLIAAAQSILLLPLIVKTCGAEAYGAWLATGEFLLCLLAFDFGLPHLLIQRAGAASAKGDHRTIGAYFATGAVILSSVGFALWLVVSLIAPLVASVFVKSANPVELTQALRIAGFATAMTIVNYGIQGLARAIQRTTAVNVAAVAGATAGFIATYVALDSEYGLLSVAIGLVARASITLAGGIGFILFSRELREIRMATRWSGEAWRDYREHSPALFTSGLSYAMMTNSQVALAATLVRPEIAVVFSVTRRAAELAKAFLDMIGYASVGGFAHLAGENDKAKTRTVYRELTATYFAAAGATMAAYVAANGAFVGLWMGESYFGGHALTSLIALGTTASGWSYLELSLLRSTGDIKASSVALTLECIARLGLMAGLCAAFGVIGLPIGALATSIVSGIWARRRQLRRLGERLEPSWTTVVARSGPFVVGIAFALLFQPKEWVAIIALILVALAASVAISATLESPLRPRFASIARRFAGRAA